MPWQLFVCFIIIIFFFLSFFCFFFICHRTPLLKTLLYWMWSRFLRFNIFNLKYRKYSWINSKNVNYPKRIRKLRFKIRFFLYIFLSFLYFHLKLLFLRWKRNQKLWMKSTHFPTRHSNLLLHNNMHIRRRAIKSGMSVRKSRKNMIIFRQLILTTHKHNYFWS